MDTTKTLLHKYENGDWLFKIYSDGTLIKSTTAENPKVEFPSSMDIKITNQCNLGCPYCHEQSIPTGNHADLNKLLEVIKILPSGVELAIGGGNPLCHPDLLPFLTELKNRGIIANLTLNQNHIKPYWDLITKLITEDLVKGIGISIVNNDLTHIKELKKLSNNIVYHVIAGVNKLEDLQNLIEIGKPKVLVLGFKQFGNGVNYYNNTVQENINNWEENLYKYINKTVISFDNLAIEQLNIRKFFNQKSWDNFYMGDDFTFTMYIDAVEEMYSETSRCSERVSFNNKSLLEYFKNK